MTLTGLTEPTKVGVPIADLLAGMIGATGVLAALYEREHTGRGRVVDTSLLSGVVGVHAYQGTRWTVAARCPASAVGTIRRSRRTASSRRPRPRSTRLRLGTALAGPGQLPRPRPRRAGAGHQRGARRAPQPAHRADRSRLADVPAEEALGVARRRRSPRRQGADARRRLHLGPDALPRAPPGRRAPHARADPAARPAPALRRQRPCRRTRATPRSPRHSASTRVGAGVARGTVRRHVRPARLSRGRRSPPPDRRRRVPDGLRRPRRTPRGRRSRPRSRHRRRP